MELRSKPLGCVDRPPKLEMEMDRNIEGQLEIAVWPPKPEIVIPLELQQIASKFQRKFRDLRLWLRAPQGPKKLDT